MKCSSDCCDDRFFMDPPAEQQFLFWKIHHGRVSEKVDYENSANPTLS